MYETKQEFPERWEVEGYGYFLEQHNEKYKFEKVNIRMNGSRKLKVIIVIQEMASLSPIMQCYACRREYSLSHTHRLHSIAL